MAGWQGGITNTGFEFAAKIVGALHYLRTNKMKNANGGALKLPTTTLTSFEALYDYVVNYSVSASTDVERLVHRMHEKKMFDIRVFFVSSI